MSKSIEQAVKDFTPHELAKMVDEEHKKLLLLMKSLEEILQKDHPKLLQEIQVKFMMLHVGNKEN